MVCDGDTFAHEAVDYSYIDRQQTSGDHLNSEDQSLVIKVDCINHVGKLLMKDDNEKCNGRTEQIRI